MRPRLGIVAGGDSGFTRVLGERVELMEKSQLSGKKAKLGSQASTNQSH